MSQKVKGVVEEGKGRKEPFFRISSEGLGADPEFLTFFPLYRTFSQIFENPKARANPPPPLVNAYGGGEGDAEEESKGVTNNNIGGLPTRKRILKTIKQPNK